MKISERELQEIEKIIYKKIKESWEMSVTATEKAEEAIDDIRELINYEI